MSQACPGLAKEIESGQLDTPSLRELVERFSAPLRQADVDTIVLGCTHYPFVALLFQQALGPSVTVMDTAKAVSEQAARLCARPASNHASTRQSNGTLHFCTSAEPAHLAHVVRHWLGLDCQVTRLT
ncbi:MAG: aspartate/glutamate racemase family protein [Aquabacterium sp.]